LSKKEFVSTLNSTSYISIHFVIISHIFQVLFRYVLVIAASSGVGELLGEVDSLVYQACKSELVFSTSMLVDSLHRP